MANQPRRVTARGISPAAPSPSSAPASLAPVITQNLPIPLERTPQRAQVCAPVRGLADLLAQIAADRWMQAHNDHGHTTVNTGETNI